MNIKATTLKRFRAGLILTVAAIAPASAASLITNGNFEDPTTGFFTGFANGSTAITGWTVTGSGVQILAAGEVVPNDTLPGGGGQKLQMNVSGGGSGDQGGLTRR